MLIGVSVFALAISVIPLKGVFAEWIVNRTHNWITLDLDDERSDVDSCQVNVHCQHGQDMLKHSTKCGETLTLECGYYCNASATIHTLDGLQHTKHGPTIFTIDELTPIVKSTPIAPNETITVTIESAEGIPLSCGAPQSIEVKLQKLDNAIVYTNWTWYNDNIVVSLWSITYCDLPLNVSVSYIPHWNTAVYRSNGSSTVMPKPLDAPGFTDVAVQDSALTLVFSDKALCSNSSWEVCITGNSLIQTQHCSIHSAQDRLLTVDAGKGNVHSVKARVLFGERRSPYSETTTPGASVLPRDKLTLSNIGLPYVQLCYVVNPSLRKATLKQLAVHYKLCGSMDERISNLSVATLCSNLQGWPGGHCYEVQLRVTMEIDGIEFSLKTTVVHKGPMLPLISLAAIPALIVTVGFLLCAVWTRRKWNYWKSSKLWPQIQSTDLTKDIPEWVCNCDSPTIEPDTKSVITTIESELSNDEEDQKHCLGDEPCNMQGAQVANKDYVCSHTALSPNKSACTSSSACTNSSSGISERYIRIYSREPSLTNFGNGE